MQQFYTGAVANPGRSSTRKSGDQSAIARASDIRSGYP